MLIVMELPTPDERDAQEAMKAGAFLVNHIAEKLVPEASLKLLGQIPLRDRVGAMLLLKIVMIYAIRARRPGFLDACAVAGHLYNLIGVSTGLEPTMKTEELLQQLNQRESE